MDYSFGLFFIFDINRTWKIENLPARFFRVCKSVSVCTCTLMFHACLNCVRVHVHTIRVRYSMNAEHFILNICLLTLFPANIRLGKDLLNMSWRRLEDDLSVTSFCLPRRLQDVIARRLLRRLGNVLKTSCEDALKTYLEDILQTRLEDVLKTSWKMKNCYAGDIFKTPRIRFGKKEMFAGFIYFYRMLHNYFI